MVVAMHMSDGLVNAPTAAIFGVIAVLGLALAVSRARADLDDRTAPMAGLAWDLATSLGAFLAAATTFGLALRG